MELTYLPSSSHGSNRVCGVYTLTHDRTGSFYIGSSPDLYMRRASHFSTLKANTHKNTPLRKLYAQHPQFSFRYQPTETLAEAKQLEAELLALHAGSVLLMNRRYARPVVLKTPARAFVFPSPSDLAAFYS